MKKSIPKVRERESEASILGNDREREFPLTPVFDILKPEKSWNFIFQNAGSGFEFNPGIPQGPAGGRTRIKYIFKLYNKYYLYI